MTTREEAERIAVEDCPECAGTGSFMSIGCCGNVYRNGECRGHCSVPTQAPCEYCEGTGQIEVEDDA